MYYYGAILFEFLLILFCLLWVVGTIQRLPSDLHNLRLLRSEGKMDVFWPELSAIIFYWIVSGVLLLTLSIPFINIVIQGWGYILELFVSFYHLLFS